MDFAESSEDEMIKLVEEKLYTPYIKKLKQAEAENKLSRTQSQKARKEKEKLKLKNDLKLFKRVHNRIQERELSHQIKKTLPSNFEKPSLSKIATFGLNFIKRKERSHQYHDLWIFREELPIKKKSDIIRPKEANQLFLKDRTTFWNSGGYSSKTSKEMIYGNSKSGEVNNEGGDSEFSLDTTQCSNFQRSTSEKSLYDVYSFVNTSKRKVSKSEVGDTESHEIFSDKRVSDQALVKAFSEDMDLTPPVKSNLVDQENFQSKVTTNAENMDYTSIEDNLFNPKIFLKNDASSKSMDFTIVDKTLVNPEPPQSKKTRLKKTSQIPLLVNASVKISSAQKKAKPKVISNEQPDVSKTNKLLKKLQQERALKFENDSEDHSKTSTLEINNNKQHLESYEINYFKPKFTDSAFKNSSREEYTSFIDENNFATYKFQPLKNSTLILSKEVEPGNSSPCTKIFNCKLLEAFQEDGSLAENTDLDTDEKFTFLKNASQVLSEETKMKFGKFSSRTEIFGSGFEKTLRESDSVHEMNFSTDKENYHPLKNSTLIASKDVKIEPQSVNKNLLDITNLKKDEDIDHFRNTSPILSRGRKIIKGKKLQFLEDIDDKAITSSRIGISSKKRKISLEGVAEVNTVAEISDSEKTTELLNIDYLKRIYGEACPEIYIAKKMKKVPEDSVSDSEKTTELLEEYLKKAVESFLKREQG